MLRSNTVPSFCCFPRLHGLRLWGGTASTGGANTPGGGGGEGSHKQLATLRSVRFRSQGRRRQRISV